MMTVVDLFCGCGGFTSGFLASGFDIILGVDFSAEFSLTYKNNFNHLCLHGDLSTKETKTKIFNYVSNKLGAKSLEVLIGGSPCQGFSLSGNRDPLDSRNRLYLDTIEIISVLKPTFICLENVKGLLSMKGVKDDIFYRLNKLGYTVDVKVLNSVDFGVPQYRERVIFLGNRLNIPVTYPEPLKKRFLTVRDAIFDLVTKKEDYLFNHVFTSHKESTINKLKILRQGDSLYPNFPESWKRCFWDKPSPTVKANNGGVFVHPDLPRVMTVRELARLQSFPDSFLFSGSKSSQFKQVGNALPVKLAEYLAKHILSFLTKKFDAINYGYTTISDISIERIKRAGTKIIEDNKKSKNPKDLSSLDIGFKFYKLV